MFTGWFYVCAGEVISWFKLWGAGVAGSNPPAPHLKSLFRELFLGNRRVLESGALYVCRVELWVK